MITLRNRASRHTKSPKKTETLIPSSKNLSDLIIGILGQPAPRANYVGGREEERVSDRPTRESSA